MYQHLYNRLQGQYSQERSWLSMPSFKIGLTYTEWVDQLYQPNAPLPTWRSDKLSCRGCWNLNEVSGCYQAFKLGEKLVVSVSKWPCLYNLRHLNERGWRTVLHNEIIHANSETTMENSLLCFCAHKWQVTILNPSTTRKMSCYSSISPTTTTAFAPGARYLPALISLTT